MRTILERLLSGEHLTAEEAGDVMTALTDSALAPAIGGALLAARPTA